MSKDANRVIENINHIFRVCNITHPLYNGLIRSLHPLNPIDSNSVCLNNWIDFWKTMCKRPFNCIVNFDTLVAYCLWKIWKSRNNKPFNNKRGEVSSKECCREALEFTHIARRLYKSKISIIVNIRWNRPNRGSFELNTDSSYFSNPIIGGIGGVIRKKKLYKISIGLNFLHEK